MLGEKRDEEGVLELAWDERKRGSGARWSDLGPNSAQPTNNRDTKNRSMQTAPQQESFKARNKIVA